MNSNRSDAPGWPGISPRWTSSAKSGIGASLSPLSHVTFTLSHGVLNEIYYPQNDLACTRDMGLLIVDGHSYFSEEKRHCSFQASLLREGVPAYHLVNTSLDQEYIIEKDVCTDPWRDVVLQRIRFRPLRRAVSDFKLLALLAPHISNHGMGNWAWLGSYKDVPMLFARRREIALAMACSVPWSNRSVGFVGCSDGWQDANLHKAMTWSYQRADNGNVALTGEIDPAACNGEFVLAIGFGRNHTEAALRAHTSLQSGFDHLLDAYMAEWESWFASHQQTGSTAGKALLSKTSLAVLRVHEDQLTCGGIIASLSIPWGQSRGDDDLGGYHLVWIRDQVEAVGGMLAAGVREDVYRIFEYLRATQESDGRWPQNMWLDGRSFWVGIQMDEIGLPILLLDLSRREGAASDAHLDNYYDMLRRAASYLVRNGPATPQDRWEEVAGYSPFTLAVEIAALLVAADFMDRHGDHADAAYLRDTADYWNSNIEAWCYVLGTPLAQRAGVDGYYVRVAAPQSGGSLATPDVVSVDALALVRFGLREATDPRILNTVKVIDSTLKVDTPFGPAWHRYNGDVYGEYADGSPYDGGGIGRLWPLFTGERGHYELAAGNTDVARQMLAVMERFTGDVGLIPEQVWDADDVPARELFFGRPSGSAMPLVWAHAEHIRLTRSLTDGRVFDLPAVTATRYGGRTTFTVPRVCWRFTGQATHIPSGKSLRLEVLAAARVRWSFDHWQTARETETTATGLGIYFCDLPCEPLTPGQSVCFTFYWREANRWEGVNFEIPITNP